MACESHQSESPRQVIKSAVARGPNSPTKFFLFFFLSSTHCSDAADLTASQEVHALGTGSVVGHTGSDRWMKAAKILSKAHVFCLMVEIPAVQGVCLKYINATCVPFPFFHKGCAHPLNQLASDFSIKCYGFCSQEAY